MLTFRKIKFFMKKKFLIANWKMNGSRDFISKYSVFSELKGSENTEIIIAPPHIYLQHTRKSFNSSVKIATQDISENESGSFTGQISASMAKDLACEYVIIGHSETREYLGQKNDNMHKKISNALKNNLNVIYCIGENKSEFDNYEKLLENQLNQIKLSKGVNNENLIIGYEPIWAIGTGKIPSNERISEISVYIKNYLSTLNLGEFLIVYGGSVSKDNAKSILSIKEINGLLVGNASLEFDFFRSII